MLERLLEAQNLAWARGDQTSVEALLLSHGQPKLSNDALLNLICNEVALREMAGAEPTLAEYQQRFPHLADELQVQWEIDRLLSTHNVPSESLPTQCAQSNTHEAPAESPLERKSPLQFAGRYEIRGEIGRGAMGIVYEAYDPRLKRTLALKRLRAGNDADPSELQRMSAEAESHRAAEPSKHRATV